MHLICTKTSTLISAILLSIIFFSSPKLTKSLNQEPSAYEMLTDYGFPKGLLLQGVTGYVLDSASGKFSAFLNGSCSFSLEGSYQLRYKSRISGYISEGMISNLEGVSVKLWFMWLDIVEVSRIGDDLEFSVGIAGAGFPVDNFEESPQCGGFLIRELSKIRFNPSVSSL
ncbi:uncharacterized protein LOC126674045 [Mercurialis annua]|uniref:uncharacterized protein LOC126674045 n=1 Tax=Mercurialis annua TaxID=3986 RepID=UPI002160B8B6|nr:uncharacterized protein LOC126674045 [Mercurialis annua]